MLVTLVVVFLTGLGALAAGEADDRWVVVVHGIAGLAILAVSPWKTRVARRGWRRRRWDRWVSLGLAALVVITVTLGLLHTVGVVRDVGGNEVLWWHVAGALIAIPFILWHVVRRRALPRRSDVRRRTLLHWGLVAGAAGVAWLALDGLLRVLQLPGAERRFTGSLEVASFRPAEMPRVIWLDDSRPDVDTQSWRLTVADAAGLREHSLAELRSMRPASVREPLDCTGGWYSVQDWDGVPLRDLLVDTGSARSITVTSLTGYWIRFDLADLDDLLVCHGYNGEALRAGHGAPVRLVAVGSRGYRWVKWVDRIELTDTPAWWQPALPLQ